MINKTAKNDNSWSCMDQPIFYGCPCHDQAECNKVTHLHAPYRSVKVFSDHWKNKWGVYSKNRSIKWGLKWIARDAIRYLCQQAQPHHIYFRRANMCAAVISLYEDEACYLVAWTSTAFKEAHTERLILRRWAQLAYTSSWRALEWQKTCVTYAIEICLLICPFHVYN